jgi:hypothetical protein
MSIAADAPSRRLSPHSLKERSNSSRNANLMDAFDADPPRLVTASSVAIISALAAVPAATLTHCMLGLESGVFELRLSWLKLAQS